MLLIGSDWRRTSPGERTDVMMVATIDPTTGLAAVASIPRDMERIPKARGGTSGSTRVNSIYYIDYRDPKLKHPRVDPSALTRLTRDIAAFLDTEIDHWAFIRFGDFAARSRNCDRKSSMPLFNGWNSARTLAFLFDLDAVPFDFLIQS